MKAGGSLGRGRRTVAELPAVPAPESLDEFDRRAQAVVRTLVERVGGRMGATGRPQIPAGNMTLLAEVFERWARRNASSREGRTYFSGRPGLWHALDCLYPLQDPNRWDHLREAITFELVQRGWVRVGGPNGMSWFLPD